MSTTYNVYRNGSLITSGLTSPAYVDTGLTDGTTYSYQVSATVNGVEGPKSSAISATPTTVPPPPPPFPPPPGPPPPPTPPPFPPPPGRPFAPPVTSGTVYVPLTIDHTGATDVSAALNTWIAGVPNGRIIVFPPDPSYIYQMSQGIKLGGRSNLILNGGGVTLKTSAGANGADQLTSQFNLSKNIGSGYTSANDICFHDFVLKGTSPTPGVYIGGTEYQMNMYLTNGAGSQANRIEVYNIVGSGAYGDGVCWAGVTDGWAHNCHFPTAGRNGVTIISGTRIINELSAFDISGYLTCDFEPDVITEAITNCYFRNNTAQQWGGGGHYGQFFGLEGSHTGAPINGVFVTGNVISGKSLIAICDNGNTSRMLNVTFSGNTSTGGSVGGPVLTFAHVDGLTVQHNTQPLSGGSLVSTTDCTSAVITPNP